MSFINAIKLALSRSGLMVKILLYDIIVLVVIAGVCAGVLISEVNYVADQIGQLDLVTKLSEGIKDYISGTNISLGESLEQFYGASSEAIEMISANVFDTAYITIAVALVVSRFLFSLRTLPTYDIMNCYMEEGANYFFMNNFIRNFSKSAKFASLQTLFSLPFDILIFGLGYFLAGFIFSTLGIFAPFVVIILLVCLIAFRYTLFFFWAPLVVKGMPIVKAFGEGLKLGMKNFGDIFIMMTTYLVFMFAIVTNLLFTTYGVGLLFALPLFFIFNVALSLVKYYDVARLRYYVTADTVITPSVVEELEITDKQKDLLEEDELMDEEDSTNPNEVE